MKDYYAILGVNRAATLLEIKRAYRKLAILYHPDKNHDPEAEQYFKEVNEAYDILGDESKKSWYDYKLYSFTRDSLSIDNLQEQRRAHRDPAYHRRKPTSSHRSRKPSIYDTMQEYLPYFSWLNWAGMTLMIIFALDYFLPTRAATEEILEIHRVKGRTNSYGFELIITPHHRIVMYGDDSANFEEGAEIDIRYTPFLRTVLEVSDRTTNHVVFLRGIYGPVFILPIILFFTSLFGILLRNNLVSTFNLSVVNGILIISIIYLILTV